MNTEQYSRRPVTADR